MSEKDKARLLSFIEQRGEDECWPYTGCIGTWGYGSFYLNGRNVNAHNATHRLLVGPVPAGKVVCHRCDNPSCCNPAHLFVGTQGDNVRDCVAKGRGRRQFEAGSGHPRHNGKLTFAVVERAKQLYASGVSQTEIGRRLGVHSATISRAVRGESWK